MQRVEMPKRSQLIRLRMFKVGDIFCKAISPCSALYDGTYDGESHTKAAKLNRDAVGFLHEGKLESGSDYDHCKAHMPLL